MKRMSFACLFYIMRKMITTVACVAGVSNFDVDEIKELIQIATRVRPAVVQRNSDPFSSDSSVRAFCASAGIQYQVPRLSDELGNL